MKSLFDIQVNGFAGVDFQSADLSAEDLLKAASALAGRSTHRFFITLITDTIHALESKLKRFELLRAGNKTLAESVCGYHLEGPWLSREPGYCGAHDPRCTALPDLDCFKRLQGAAAGNIRLVTLAPELPGSDVFIRELVDSGVAISLGHTDAGVDDISCAIDAGACFCTHLGNAVPAAMDRHDNVINRLLSRDELTAFFIPDGLHLPPFVLQNYVRAKPAGKALFATDCMAAADASEGRCSLGSLELEIGEDRIVRMPGGTNFAGSSLCADEGVRNVAEWLGWSQERAWAAFSTDVAKLFAIDLPELDK